MIQKSLFSPSFFSLLLSLSFLLFSGEGRGENRPAALAGSFYPADPIELQAQLDTFIPSSPSPLPSTQRVVGMIVPHAGYGYSGEVAALAYRLLQNQPISTVFLIGPSHEKNFRGASIWTKDSWETPLGNIPVHTQLAKRIKKWAPLFKHSNTLHNTEHSLETQIPFIQKVLPHATIVPILISNPIFSKRLANVIRPYLEERSDVVVIASSDLSHYHPDFKARAIDQRTLGALLQGIPSAFLRKIKQKNVELCGDAAVLTLLELKFFQKKGAMRLLGYKHSGHVTGDKDRVVGYASLVWEVPKEEEPLVPALPEEARQLLQEGARNALSSYLSTGIPPEVTPSPHASLERNSGIFVTLETADGALRGCVGQVDPVSSLWEGVQSMAIQAGTQDSRFPPVTLNELPSLSFKISLLSDFDPVTDISNIILGTHGVLVKKDEKSGIFLPEVAKNFVTRNDFLSTLCEEKAGLDPKDWKSPDTQLFRFTTTVVT
jgi:hypothetical protein